MSNDTRRSHWILWPASLAAVLLMAVPAHAQLTANVDRNVSQRPGSDSECAMAKNPANTQQLFAFCNAAGVPGLLAARSTDGGITWIYPDPTDKTIADGDPNQGPNGCCDPSLAWDSFGNLYISYINAAVNSIETILSTDGGATFTNLASFAGSVDQETVVAANTTAPGAPVAVWLVWNQSGQMVGRGAPVTGLGAIGAFVPLTSAPSSGGCSFGDVAIAPTGVVVQVCGPNSGQTGGNINVWTDADGLGPGGWAGPVVATTTLVGGFDFIPAQNTRSIDSETGLVFDAMPTSPHFGRLYLMYTDEIVQESNNTDIELRFSDNNGVTWSPTDIRVNDDATVLSQFNPKISMDDPATGNFMVCWHDCRESAPNTFMREYCTAAGPNFASPAFLPNIPVGDGLSVSNNDGFDFGDYSGLDYFAGGGHPIWGDRSNNPPVNPDGNFDAQTDRVIGNVPVELMHIQIE
jgi:hypothetical protein